MGKNAGRLKNTFTKAKSEREGVIEERDIYREREKERERRERMRKN